MWLIHALGLWIISNFVKGLTFKNFFTAFLAAIILTGVTKLFRPALLFLTLPVNILTLGLFTFVVNGALLKFTAFLLPGFSVKKWSSAIGASILLTIFLFLAKSAVGHFGVFNKEEQLRPLFQSDTPKSERPI